MTTYRLDVITSGSAGSATGSKTTDEQALAVPRGLLTAVKVSWPADAPNTATLTLSEATGLQRTLITITGTSATTFYPSIELQDSTGTGRAQYGFYAIDGEHLQGSLTGVSAGTYTVRFQTLV